MFSNAREPPARATKRPAVKAILFALDESTAADPRTAGLSLFQFPLYDQPALRYAFANLMNWNVRDILVVGPGARLMPILGDGSDYGLRIAYTDAPSPFDLFAILQQHAKFFADDQICLMSAANVFWGPELGEVDVLRGGAKILAQQVTGHEHYSKLEIDSQTWRVPDLGFYEAAMLEVARGLTSSGSLSLDLELLNRDYAEKERLEVVRIGEEVIWCDLRNWESLWIASCQVAGWEQMLGSKAACLEEIALGKGLIGQAHAESLFERYQPGLYRDYLKLVFVANGIWPEEEKGLRLVSSEE